MIQEGTKLQVSDNSGARIVECIKVLHNPGKKMGRTGSLIVVSVKSLIRKQKAKVKKGSLYKGVVCETRKIVKRVDGSHFVSPRNTVVLLNVNNRPIGSRIQGVTPHELRLKGRTRLLSLSLANV